VLIVAEAGRPPSKRPGKRPGFLETIRQPVRPPRAIAGPGGVGPKGTGGRRKPAEASSNGSSPVGTPVDQPDLLRRREELSRKFAELQWDLGGLTYEMAIRDQFRPDLLARRAAELQQLDAELASIDRLLHIEQGGAAGACPACGALFTRGAAYCWQCGAGLVSQPPVTPTPSPAPPTPSSAVPPAQPPAA
jgi:hypothetical protein